MAVFGSSAATEADVLYLEAMRLGALLGGAGHVVATGGYGGVMEAVSRGAAEADGRVVGVVAPTVFPHRSGANRWVHEEIRAASITERIHLLVSLADATIALPGSIGTATELMVAWNVNHVASASGRPPLVHVAVGSHWDDLISLVSDRYGAVRSQIGVAVDVEAAFRLVDGRSREETADPPG